MEWKQEFKVKGERDKTDLRLETEDSRLKNWVSVWGLESGVLSLFLNFLT